VGAEASESGPDETHHSDWSSPSPTTNTPVTVKYKFPEHPQRYIGAGSRAWLARNARNSLETL
jgi:hypothetical protein